MQGQLNINRIHFQDNCELVSYLLLCISMQCSSSKTSRDGVLWHYKVSEPQPTSSILSALFINITASFCPEIVLLNMQTFHQKIFKYQLSMMKFLFSYPHNVLT